MASFSSPCVLPLVPAYLSVVGGLDITRRLDVDQGSTAGMRGGWTVTRDTALFVSGFGAVFVVLGLSASTLGRTVIHNQATLTRVSGVVVVVMALFLAGTLLFRNPNYYREWRLHPRLARLGPFAAPVAGGAFAFGWTPCVGPVLGSVLALSASQGHIAGGALLLAVYSLGLGVPFLVVSLFFDRLEGPLAWIRNHGTAVTAWSAAGLALLGVLLILDRLAWVTTQFQRL